MFDLRLSRELQGAFLESLICQHKVLGKKEYETDWIRELKCSLIMRNKVDLHFKKREKERDRLSDTEYLKRVYEVLGKGFGTGDTKINNASLNTEFPQSPISLTIY